MTQQVREVGPLFPTNVYVTPEAAQGFTAFFAPLNKKFTHWQQNLLRNRQLTLANAAVNPPKFLDTATSERIRREDWSCTVPDWCQDQRNQMTGPADDAELVVKMLNSGAPGVMLDLEDSMANTADRHVQGIANVIAALHGDLTYVNRKTGETVGVKESDTVVFVRPRGLHMKQQFMHDLPVSASLFDVALLVYQLDFSRLKHPLCIYIPKSESAAEALWWKELFEDLAAAKGRPKDYIKCMALVESHPMAYQMEEFLYTLRDHIMGLNLGRWDYMASLIHYRLHDPNWVLPDRNTIPSDVPFFQNLRQLLVTTCHSRGALAIGGMTALYPSRTDAELNARALAALEKDKKNEAACGMDGAWTGHPDQNAIATAQFPEPNQLEKFPETVNFFPDLRPVPTGVGEVTAEGTKAAIRTCILYRMGVQNGKGASLINGFMEDLATDRIYRLMIAQRIRHGVHLKMDVLDMFHATVFALLSEAVPDPTDRPQRSSMFAALRAAADTTFQMISLGEFDPS